MPGIKTDLPYVDQDVPDFDLSAYRGERYRSEVPATFDVQERARVAQNALTRAVDPDLRFRMYFWVELARNPAKMWHSGDDHCQVKYTQALPLLRQITGDREALEVDQTWLENAFLELGEDGLNYYRSWPHFSSGFLPFLDDPQAQFFHFSASTYLPTFAAQYALTGQEQWVEAMRRQTHGLAALAQEWEGTAYLPMVLYGYPARPHPEIRRALGSEATHAMGYCTQGLGLYYAMTGDALAGDLARKLCYYLKDHAACYDAEGRFLPEYPPDLPPGPVLGSHTHTHFHSHTLMLLNMSEYAWAARDEVLLGFIQRSFEWARDQAEVEIELAAASGTGEVESSEVRWEVRRPVALLGAFPENLAPWHEEIETCEVADMIGLALKLSAAGIGDYWDDADRWIRNQFAENQLLDTDWMQEWTDRLPRAEKPGPEATEDDVLERNRGAFAGWALPGAWMDNHPLAHTQIMHCCTGNGARALYYIWEHIISQEPGRLRINLLLNRAAAAAEIKSHLPQAGRVEIEMRQATDLSIRIPGWASHARISCRIDGKEAPLRFSGRYLQLPGRQPGQRVTLELPLLEVERQLQIQKRWYRVTQRGADIVEIDPRGSRGPLYLGRGGPVQTREVERFVPEREVEW